VNVVLFNIVFVFGSIMFINSFVDCPSMAKFLITGGAGFVGTILTNKLLFDGEEVKVLDSLVFGGSHLIPNLYSPNFELIHSSIASVNKSMLKACDTVVHLAAITFTHGDYMERQISDVNFECTKRLVDLCKKEKKRLVFSSTCSNYGESGLATEESPLFPTNAYAHSKTNAEKYIQENYPSACILRLATVFGLSPRMRFDTTVNEFVLNSVSNGYLSVYNYDAWRPYIHIDDVTDAMMFFLGNKELSGVFNVGDDDLNYSKRMLCDSIQKFVPNLQIDLQKTVNDPRNYRVSFDKINDAGFKTKKTIQHGIAEVKSAIERKMFLNPHSDIFDNFKTYQKYYSANI
jgi:nucleoside-diphosphate-sugar epimerase